MTVESGRLRLGPLRLLGKWLVLLLVVALKHLLHTGLLIERRVVGLLALLPGPELGVDFAGLCLGRICDFRRDVIVAAQSLSARNRL